MVGQWKHLGPTIACVRPAQPEQNGRVDADRVASGTDPHPERDDVAVTGDVCWLAATCAECGALVEGGTCWSCGAHRAG